MMLTACVAERDNAAWYNPLGDKIYGLWYADYPESGIVGVDKPPYSRVVQAVKFNADGTGTWWKAMFTADDASKPLAPFGGRYLENGTFDYSVAADGTIRAKRRGEKGQDGSPMALVFHYQDGAITFGDGIAAQTMKPAPKDYDNLLLALENSMHGAEMVDFNINDGEIAGGNDAAGTIDGTTVSLTRTEYTLLHFLKQTCTDKSCNHYGQKLQSVWIILQISVVKRIKPHCGFIKLRCKIIILHCKIKKLH